MKHFKLLLFTIIICTIAPLKAQWVVTNSSEVSASINQKKKWKIDSDINDQYTVITYGSSDSGDTNMTIFNNSSPTTPIIVGIPVFNNGSTVSRVKLSSNNMIYVLGVEKHGAVNVLEIKKFNLSGGLVHKEIVDINIGEAFFDFGITDNDTLVVSQFVGSDLIIKFYRPNLTISGNFTVGTGIMDLNANNRRAQFLDVNGDEILIGYSHGVDRNSSAYIKKYEYNTVNPFQPILKDNWSFSGGFNRKDLNGINNSHQVALRANGDVFYINGSSGVKRISGTNRHTVFPLTNSKVNVDKSDRLLLSWTNNTGAKGLLFNDSNASIRYYQEGGNITGSLAPAIYNCQSVMAGDDIDVNTSKKPFYQMFNCSDCQVGAPATPDFNFRYANKIVQKPSLNGPQDVTELCLVDKLWVDGTPSCSQDGYMVEIAEFDLRSWTDKRVLHSSWVCASCPAPNNIDIASYLPAGYQLRPNKVYRFRLAVGNQWVNTGANKFFTIACCKRPLVQLLPKRL